MKCRIRSVFFLLGLFCALTILRQRASSAVPPQRSLPGVSGSSRTSSSPHNASTPEEAALPGPLRSFLRMSAISQKVTPEEVLPLLARNVVMSGYESGRPTEFLVLVNWYMDQARELEALAGKAQVI